MSSSINTNSIIKPVAHEHALSADLHKNPPLLPQILSFLKPEERDNARMTCKKWDILASHDPLKDHIVKNGYGDFVLIDPTGKDVNKGTFEKAFACMNQYLPQVHQKPVKDRLEEVNILIKKQCPESNLKAVFIPRTLYELCYLLQNYEDLKLKEI
jgi:hypothetical protein